MKLFGRLFLFMLFLGLSVSAVSAEEPTAVDAKAATDKAAMEKMKATMAPGEAHKVLEPLAGQWNYTAKFWMSPEAKPDESTGTGQNTMIYGGRFLKEEVKGTWGGEPFEGVGYTGYDNIKGEYVSSWIDSVATGIMSSSGPYDVATKTLKLSGENSCPLTGEKARKGRMETTLTDNDHHTLASYSPGPDGKEFKMMEIVYTRA